jgi:hypothetical protein
MDGEVVQDRGDHGVRTCRSSGECDPSPVLLWLLPILGHLRRLRHFHVILVGFPSPSSCRRRVTIALSPPIEIRHRVTEPSDHLSTSLRLEVTGPDFTQPRHRTPDDIYVVLDVP